MSTLVPDRQRAALMRRIDPETDDAGRLARARRIVVEAVAAGQLPASWAGRLLARLTRTRRSARPARRGRS